MRRLRSLVVELLGDVGDLVFILVADGDEDAAFALDGVAGCDEAFVEGFEEGFANAQNFAGGFHFWPELGVDVGELLEGEDWHLHGDVFAGWINAGAVAEIDELFTEADAGGEIDHWHAGDLADVWHGALARGLPRLT